jgi:hypothetical protein
VPLARKIILITGLQGCFFRKSIMDSLAGTTIARLEEI